MAEEKIIINFKAVGNKALTRAIRELDNATKSATNQSKKQATAAGVLGTNHKRLTNTNNFLANSFATIRSKMLLLTFAMSMGIRQVIQLVAESAKIESMGRAFTTLSGGTENSAIAMNKLREATNGTMNQFDLFQQANNAMVLGVSKNSEEMAEMFDIAQRLGRALGRDTKTSVESLITGIGRQSRLMLDNIGIIVKSDEAYEAYADKLGITADKLTDADKKQAFLTATMESARHKVSQLGNEILGLQDNLDKLGASTDDAGTAFGTYISKAFGASKVSSALAFFFEGAKNFFEFQSLMIDRAAEWNAELETSIGQTEELASVIAQWNKEQESIGETIGDGIITLSFVNELYAKSKEVQLELVDARIAVLESFIAMHGATNKEAVVLQELIDLREKLTKQTDNNGSSIDKMSEKEKLAISTMNQFSSSMSNAILNANDFEDAISATSVAFRKALTSMAVEMASRAALFALFSSLTGGVGAFAMGNIGKFALTGGVAHKGGLIKDDGQIQRFATGGSVRGGDNVPILAQGGEFVMQRSAVQSIGIENLNRMNQGGGGASVVVNVSGNVMSQDYVEGELAEQIKEAIRKGNDFGVS